MITVVGLISIALIGTLSFIVASETVIDKTEEKLKQMAKEDVICSQEVIINLENACYKDKDTINIFVANNGMRNIESFIVRFFSKDQQVKLDKNVNGLHQFMVNNLEIKWDDKAEDILRVELIPKINLNEKELVCSAAKKRFGDINSNKTIPQCT